MNLFSSAAGQTVNGNRNSSNLSGNEVYDG